MIKESIYSRLNLFGIQDGQPPDFFQFLKPIFFVAKFYNNVYNQSIMSLKNNDQ